MKKLQILLLILTISLASCSKEDLCTSCKEIEESAPFPYNDYTVTGREFPTAYNCDSNGYSYYTNNTIDSNGIRHNFRNRVECR